MAPLTSCIITALASAAGVAAHGHVDWLIADGVAYRGYDSPAFSYDPNPPQVVGWTIDQKDNGFVEPAAFGSSDIICHRSSSPAPGHATVKAGAKMTFVWNTWPESHKGPVLDYLAKCSGNCEDVDPASLEFFKIGESGLIDMSLSNGYWADDVLIENSFSWTVQIPSTLAAGNYVLRHEIIALHSAGNANGAQAYPQCFNIQVTDGGSLSPAGVKGTALYKSDDGGILFNLYTSPLTYPIPGPTLVSGLSSSVAQSVVAATATSSATIPGAVSAAVTAPQATTLQTSSKAASAATTTAAAAGTVQKYGQCGGQGWTGATGCVSGSTCQVLNAYYSQCL